jgi:hypothetical protein
MILATMYCPEIVWAQTPAERCASEPQETKQSCIEVYQQGREREEEWNKGRPRDPTPPPPRDIGPLVRDACGVILPPQSPNGKSVVVVAAAKRETIDHATQLPHTPSAEVESIHADACFQGLGDAYVVLSPSDRPDMFSIVGNGSPLGRWVVDAAGASGRVRLPPKSECEDLLNRIGDRGRAVWVEDEGGVSLCELDRNGKPSADRGKINGYSGVIVLKVTRGQ